VHSLYLTIPDFRQQTPLPFVFCIRGFLHLKRPVQALPALNPSARP
jgi:hypothetical protein